MLNSLKEFLQGRRMAYHHVFNPESVFTKRVLKDLARFCRAHEPTFHEDPRVHAALEGRREVWLRIEKHLNLDPETFWRLFGKVEE